MKKFVIAIAVVILAAFAVPAFAAMNPFMDVPASHWAYDAVAQLAARGVISGYPDGTYKGAQPSTRYEMASALARALAKIDMEKASKQDVEMLKKLIVEFKDELDALGVKVDKLDDRVKILEGDIGGWSISGQFRFDAKFGNDEDFYGDSYNMNGKSEFDLNRYRMFFRKRINETTNFTARIGASGGTTVAWQRYYITTKLPYDIELTVGRQYFEWEDELGFYIDDDTLFGGWAMDMFWFKKDWGMANLQLIVARENDRTGFPDATTDPMDYEKFMIAGLANFDVNEKFRAGVMAYYFFSDDDEMTVGGVEQDTDHLTFGVYAGYRFIPTVELKGIYYHQSQGGYWENRTNTSTLLRLGEDDAQYWRVILDVDQEALKFTSLWVEYGQMDNNFYRKGNAAYGDLGTDILDTDGNWFPVNTNSSKILGVKASQKWNDKWRTFARYWSVDLDTAGRDDVKQWGLGVGYRLNPAIEFELAYDNVDYGNNRVGRDGGEDDSLIRFRTFVTF